MNRYLVVLIFLAACGSDLLDNDKSSDPARVVFEELLTRDVSDLDHQGDGFLWKAKFCSFADCDMDEFDNEGRAYRTKVHSDSLKVSNTTWSGDMARCGMIPYSLLKNGDQLRRHVKYGERVKWKMGDLKPGLSLKDQIDGATRVNYSASLIASFYIVRDYLDNGKPSLPLTMYYNKNLDDYQAHLQACSIFTDIEMHGKSIEFMSDIVKSNYNRVPKSPFYAYLHAKINGDFGPITEICKSDEIYTGDYIRCDGSISCGIAEKVFGCGLFLRDK